VSFPTVERDELRTLGLRSDGPARAHFAFQLPLFAASAWATASLASGGSELWWAAACVCAVAVLMFFPMLHETGHQTAFESDSWNEVACWLGALFMLQAPSFFREFHLEHHRSTQDPEKDPEISGAPNLLGAWPSNPFVYLGVASGQPLMVGKLAFTVMCALLPIRVWAAAFPFVREQRRGLVARESRIALAALVGSTALGLSFVPGFGYVLLAWPIAHLLLGFYLMSEHTGLPETGSQLERTRTVHSNALVRWIMWNMPYHAEHHQHPGIPFHALPELHERLSQALVHTSAGYLAFHREALTQVFRRR
jgi:fatty acid desaturase